MRIPDKIAVAAKAWLAGIGLVVTAATEALADDVLEFDEIGTLISVGIAAVVSIFAVYRVGNRNIEAPAGE